MKRICQSVDLDQTAAVGVVRAGSRVTVRLTVPIHGDYIVKLLHLFNILSCRYVSIFVSFAILVLLSL